MLTARDMSRAMPKDFILKLIKLYRKHTCLWKISSVKYKEKSAKVRAYRELVTFCRTYYPAANRYSVSKKIQNLRCSARKEMNKLEASNGSYTPLLWYFQHLSFVFYENGLFTKFQNAYPTHPLKTELESDSGNSICKSLLMKPMKEFNSIDIIDVGKDDNSLYVEDFTPISNDEDPLQIMRTTNGTSDFAQLPPPPPLYKRARLNREETTSSPAAATIATAINSETEMKVYLPDEFEAIGISIAAKLKKMNDQQKMLAECLISKILMKGIFNELTSDTSIAEDSWWGTASRAAKRT